MPIFSKDMFRIYPLNEDAKKYLFETLFKHVQTTILLAYFTAIGLMLFELKRPTLVLIWLIPMCVMQLLRYVIASQALAKPTSKLRHFFLVIDNIAMVWWVSYIIIFGWQTTSSFEYAFRTFLVFIIITFYLNVMRYHLANLVINSATICAGILIYLVFFTQLPVDFKWPMGLLTIFGFFALLLYGRMSYTLACQTYFLIEENQRLIQKMDMMLIEDELTKQRNRRFFNAELTRHILLFNRTEQPFCLAIFDIDFFKHVNDTYGHDVGDAVLIELGKFIRNQIRNTDTFARYGGEEFVIIFPFSLLAIAVKILEKLRVSCENHVFQVNQLQLKITISIGVTEVEKSDNEVSILKRADNALYDAKQSGRNRVAVMQSEMQQTP